MFNSSHSYNDYIVENAKTPFSLVIIIHSAEKLAIADYTSSDPYVLVTLGDKIIGKTNVVLKNLNPSWEAVFEVPMFHPHHIMVILYIILYNTL